MFEFSNLVLIGLGVIVFYFLFLKKKNSPFVLLDKKKDEWDDLKNTYLDRVGRFEDEKKKEVEAEKQKTLKAVRDSLTS